MPNQPKIYRNDAVPTTPNQGDLMFNPANNTFLVFNGTAWVQARFTSLTLTDAASEIVPGATSFAIRDTADSANNLLVSDAGRVTIREDLVFSTAATQIVPGATSFAIRNNADNADNFLMTNAGVVTFTGAITTTSITPTAGFTDNTATTPAWYIPGASGNPTGAVASLGNRAAVYWDTANSRLWARFSGSWYGSPSFILGG